MPIQCPQCGRFLPNSFSVTTNGFEDIINVVGYCKRCGEVHPTNWVYEDFFPEGGIKENIKED